MAPSSHLCLSVWHHHHTCVGQCGTTITPVLVNECDTTITPVLASVAPPSHRVSPPGDSWCDERRQNRISYLSFFHFLETFNLPHPNSITLGSRNIAFTDSTRNLGFILDSKLSMKRHVIKICQTAYFSPA